MRRFIDRHQAIARRKCSFLYYYYMDREFGFMHVRVQTWLPFTIQVCINGREYLARRMDRAGIAYRQRDNCFTWIEDVPRAQRMMDDLERRRWPRVLNVWARRVVRDGRPYRPLRPITAEDSRLFQVVLRGEFAIRGFENRDLRSCLFSAREQADPVRRRKASGRVTRWLRLLRSHGLIRKVPRTRYYRVTEKGYHVMSTALVIRESDVTTRCAA